MGIHISEYITDEDYGRVAEQARDADVDAHWGDRDLTRPDGYRIDAETVCGIEHALGALEEANEERDAAIEAADWDRVDKYALDATVALHMLAGYCRVIKETAREV